MKRFSIVVLCAFLFASAASARVAEIKTDLMNLQVDTDEGTYSLSRTAPPQQWAGTFNGELGHVMQGGGQDELGAFDSISFIAGNDDSLEYQIHIYKHRPLALFSWSSDKALAEPPAEFPNFTTIPANLRIVSYSNRTFSIPQFDAEQNTGSPYVMFDDQGNTTIISPAANFMTASLHGDAKTSVSSGFVPTLANLPEKFAHRTIIAFDKGINHTYETWGDAMIALSGAKRPANDADVGLKYLGYWTDNRATYYYHYDADKGYAGTILAVRDEFKKLGIVFGYMQLDSWWYQKTSTNYDGKEGAAKKAKDLPEGSWNKYGGLLEWTAHPDLFPSGLAVFQKELGLPLICHNRWIDVNSPYRKKYQISGVGAVDPGYWDEIAQYCKANNIAVYEQDWLDRIYNTSPEFQSTPDKAEAFMDNMSRATTEHGVTMQYCMTLPRHYLQGAKYDNLTNVRVSDDGFGRSRWSNALYVQALAGSLKEWPWVDVFMSRQTPSILFATLTAGLVGVGDPIGQFDKDNLLYASRSDGVLVKPDRPITPIDRSFIADASKQSEPMIAATYSQTGDLKTAYAFVYPQNVDQHDFHFTAADIGLSGEVYVYDWKNKTGKKIAAGESFSGSFGSKVTTAPSDPTWAYFIVAPVTKSGIALIGDAGKFASMGRQRIEKIEQTPAGLTATVKFATGEETVTLCGCDREGRAFEQKVASDNKESVEVQINSR